jgi:hypothetical protein
LSFPRRGARKGLRIRAINASIASRLADAVASPATRPFVSGMGTVSPRPARLNCARRGNARRKLAKKREAIGFVGRVGMIGDEALEDAFGDFRTFYITFAKIFSTAPAQVRPSRRVSRSPTFIP